jgi:hypothetical protein
MYDGLLGSSTDIEKGFYTESKTLQKIFNRKKRGLLGCNFSAMKSDLLAVNGFDERYEKPTIGEDSDIQFRFELLGKNIISINHIAVQYHLYHPPQPRPQQNLLLFEQVKREHKAFTPFGIEH